MFGQGMSDYIKELQAENERLARIEAVSVELLRECDGGLPPSLGTMAKLADAVHTARRKP